MKTLDYNNLFSIFNSDTSNVFGDMEIGYELDNDFIEFYSIVKEIENYHLIDKIYIKKKIKEYIDKRELVKVKYFSRIFNKLNQYNIEIFEDVVKRMNEEEIVNSIDCLYYMLSFFEQKELYERCGIIKPFIDLLLDEKEFSIE